jgi:hypothetical protein
MTRNEHHAAAFVIVGWIAVISSLASVETVCWAEIAFHTNPIINGDAESNAAANQNVNVDVFGWTHGMASVIA